MKAIIRRLADDLLKSLSAAYIENLTWDNREIIKKRLNDIKESNIDWDKDVARSVKARYRQLTGSGAIKAHMERKGDTFRKV